MSDEFKPDPASIGGVAKPPLAFLPTPVSVFQTRARRFAFLAETSELAPYLVLLAGLTRLQARLVATLPAPAPLSAGQLGRAAAAAMPPIDRASLVTDPDLAAALDAVLDGAAELEMPAVARQALAAVVQANADQRHWLLANVLADEIPAEATAEHLFAALAVQVHLARLAASLEVATLAPVGIGVCPACGGRPVSSSVMGLQGIENVRYATCAGCATQWNEVRIRCLGCGTTKGLGYRSVGTDEATVKAETCSGCQRWFKIFYQVKNASLEPVADDVGSLGLDLLMQDTPYRRAGFNPLLVGY
ncbi:MAG: formate dehydrogenase accessory protein FdhE [Xanthomonadales bacterium]|nr:formate dehydrogenase accessory protein FdhE [Xanthomonadales bacterium]